MPLVRISSRIIGVNGRIWVQKIATRKSMKFDVLLFVYC